MVRQTFALWISLVGLAASGLAGQALAEEAGSAELAALPANQWVVFREDESLTWRRQGHAGAAYDTKRGTLLLFGSNSHGDDWDNSVHEFDPATKQWTTHYPPADPSTYRADEHGNRISGPPDRLLPWAMHTYDSVLYDPELDALIVASVTAHTTTRQPTPGANRDPLWIYDLAEHRWRIFDSGGQPVPVVFASASAYDAGRDTVMVYGGNGSGVVGMYELGPDRRKWHQVAPAHHEIHFNMDYDSKRGTLAVFGNYGNTNTVWIYRPHKNPGKAGRWEKHTPEGECPPGQTFPVAFDTRAGVFLLVSGGVTCVYDPDADRYTVLRDAKIPPLEGDYNMNYQMVYDERHGVFLVVTGGWRASPVVWALRLDLTAL
jgi:hypothetical protein